MSRRVKKNATVIIYDLKTNIQEEMKQTLLRLFTFNCLCESKDLFMMVFANASKTLNRLALMEGGYKGINKVTGLLPYQPEEFIHIFTENDIEPGESNWLESLLVAIDIIENEINVMNEIVTKQILFVTDLSHTTTSPIDEKNLGGLIQRLNENSVYLHIMGPPVKYKCPLTSIKDIINSKQQLIYDNKSPELARIISEVENIFVSDLTLGYTLTTMYKIPKQCQPWNQPLVIGHESTGISIPASTMVYLVKRPIKVKIEPTAEKSNPSQKVWVDAENDDIKYNYADLVHGVSRHGKFVPNEDRDQFKPNKEKNFEIIGFTDKSNISEYLLMGEGSHVILPNHRALSFERLSVLIDCLAEKNKYAVACRTYSRGSKPKYFALIPKPEYKMKCFIMTELPYGGSVKLAYNETKVDMEEVKQAVIRDEVNEFFTGLDIHNSNCQIEVPFSVNLLHDTENEKIVDKVLEKCFSDHYDDRCKFDLLNGELPESFINKALDFLPKMPVKSLTKKADHSDDSEFEF